MKDGHRLEVQGEEIEGGKVHEVEVQGVACRGRIHEDVVADDIFGEYVIGDDVVGEYDLRGDEFMQANNLVYDDFDTEAFMREDYLDEDYEPLHDAENEEDNINEILDDITSYFNENDVDGDLGPILNDVGAATT
ncbi:hypothetical protein LIER_32922 [Lithospermum erythrorhizon]|uniref:Uncharacterized protein n=1 Tax=Lithospermum erythrorhizon TaxID=34254 RepID=A0AAV3RW59_LITER